ncbi:hypothetical protein, partial [Vibrio cholerae]|uniref:hypothetical protein n=1 Tax=Vibrio cholerae TaxID=666 RepID=UPI001C10E880
PGGDGGNLKKENLFFDYNANKEKNRASNNVYTKETADACCASFHPHGQTLSNPSCCRCLR